MLTLFKALADSTRLRLVAILWRGEFTVQELTRMLEMGQSRVSRHLKILLDAEILAVKRQGTWSYYRLSGDNPLFEEIRPALEARFAALPGSDRDLAALSRVLDERRRRSQQFFDHHARQWDELARRLLPTPDYRQELLRLVPDLDPVLEVGVGTGKLLLEMLRNGRRVIGVDHSPAMLEEARAYLETKGEAAIDLRLGEMGHLPVSDGEAGCVVLNMVLHHAPDPAAVLGAAARVLRPNGCLILADLQKHGQEWVRERLADQWLGFEEEELAQWLRRAGFSSPRFVSIPRTKGQHGVLLLRAHKAVQSEATIHR